MRIELAEWGRAADIQLSDQQVQQLSGSSTFTLAPSSRSPGVWDLGATQLVGFAHIGDLHIRVQPKVAAHRLFELLVGSVDRIAWDQLDASWAESEDLVSTVAGAFVSASEAALRSGILQGYVTRSDELNAVRGRIDMSRHVARGAGLPLPITVTYDEYTTDVIENQLLAGAGRLLLRLPAISGIMQRRLRRLQHQLLDVRPIRPSPSPPSIAWTRLNSRYRPAVTLARIILRSGMLEFEGPGSTSAPSFLVDMNKVFEDFVGLGVRDALSAEFRVDLQRSDHLDRARSIRFQPDIVIRSGHRPVAVADIKYKRTASAVSSNDLYQAVAYAVRLGLTGCTLIYPEQPDVEFLQIADVRIWLTSVDLDQPASRRAASIRALSQRLVS